MPTFVHRCIILLAALSLHGAGRTQVPAGHAVLSHFSTTGVSGGLLAFSPARATAGGGTPILGLSSELTGLGVTSNWGHGASTVRYRPSDGALVVGEHTRVGDMVDIHVIHLQGLTAVRDVKYPLGISTSWGNVNQLDLTSREEIVFSIENINGFAPDDALGVLDPHTGSIRTLQLSRALVGRVNALAVDPLTDTVFVAELFASHTDIHVVPLRGSTPALLTTVPGTVTQLTFHGGGLCVSSSGSPYTLSVIDPYSLVVRGIHRTLTSNGLAVEPATGHLISWGVDLAGGTYGMYRVDPNGATTQLVRTQVQTGSGVTIHPNPEAYGSATPGSRTYDWDLSSRASGLPVLGNAGFTLHTTLPAVGQAAVVAMSLAGSPSGSFFLVDPFQVFLTDALPATGILSLPIPSSAGSLGAEVFLQVFYLDAAASLGVATTRGVSVQVF